MRWSAPIAAALWLGFALPPACGQSARPGLGALPYADAAGTGTTFRVWAPNATSVVVYATTWSDVPLVAEGGGRWSVDVPGAVTGQSFRYRINDLNKRDPRARRVTNSGTNGYSIIYQADAFDWGGVTQPKPGRKDTVIYQMHVGTFAGSPTPRTFDHATNLLDHVKNLGVSAVQVMPVNEFAGSQSWGYNPADPFAIESSYGGPEAFKRFVRACHERGMAVFVDVVHNHYGPGDLSMWRLDGWWLNNYGGVYFYNDARAGTPWGNTRPDYGRSQVREYIRDQILMFVNEYRIGGFRWDAPYYIINSDQGHNQSGEHMLRDINWELSRDHAHVQRIAEDNAFDYSMNFQGQWDVDSRWVLHGQVTTPSDANRNMYTVRDLLRDWASLDRVLFSEAHDYVASNHGRSRLPSEIDGGNPESIWARKRSLLAAGIVMTAPAIPMIFQGQEMLETQAFHDNVPLRWDRTNSFAGIVRAYGDLVHVRRNLRGGTKGLKGTGINVHHVDNNNKVIGYVRWDAGGKTDDVVVIANFANKNWTGNTYSIGFPSDGVWYRHYNGDATNYQSDFGNIGPTQVVVSGGAATVNMGRYSLQIFTREPPTGAPEGPVPPTVLTAPVADITNTTATGGGEVTDDGGAPVTGRGVVWNTIGAPTANDPRAADGAGVGSFSVPMTGLTIGQTYYVRAYASNSAGLAYGEEVSFEAGGLATPGLAVTPVTLEFSAMLGSAPAPASQAVFVTNGGIGLLLGSHHQHHGAGPDGWLSAGVTNFQLATGGSTSQLLSAQSASFTETGVFVATNRVDGNQTNGPVDVVVTLTVTGIPPPSVVTAVADGAELVRLTASEPAGRPMLVVHRAGAPPDVDPANGVAYSVGSELGSGRVVFKFTGSPTVSNLEHEVAAGQRNHYAFYAINNNRYSPAAGVVATSPMYRVGAIVETFGYTKGIGLQARSGGQGWTNAWTLSVPRTNVDAVVEGGNFADFPAGWPDESGNRLALKTTNNVTYAAFRRFAAVTNGAIYVAALYRRQFGDSVAEAKFSGVSFFDGAGERAFIGERGSSGNDDMFGVTISGITSSVYGASNSFPAAVEYVLVGRYDFAAATMSGLYFTNRNDVPVAEPGFLTSVSGTIARIDGIRLAAGAASGWNGDVWFDEIRIATSWSNLWRVALDEAGDTDGDGTPDGWMQRHFGQPTGSVDQLTMGWQDADGDDMSNLDEFIAGTHPLELDSCFRIEQIDADSLAWRSVTGRAYDVEAWLDEAWSLILSNQPGTGAWLELPATNAPPHQWYRARVRLAP